jgi:quinol monooxygenase YgiN
MAEHAHLVRVTEFQPRDGKRDAAVAEMHALVEEFRNLEGCFGAQVCSVQEDGGSLAVISRWESQQALEKLRGTDVARQVQERIAPLVQGSGETRHYVSM